MLVLTRRIGEEIVIDGNIRIRVTEVRGERVRLGVTAPASVRVDRHEVHHKRQQLSDPEHGQPLCAPQSPHTSTQPA